MTTAGNGGYHGSVLIAENDEKLRDLLLVAFGEGGFVAAAAGTAAQALKLAAVHDFSVIVMDPGLPDMRGDRLLAILRQAGIRSRIVVLSAWLDAALEELLPELRADKVFPKPVCPAELLAAVRELAATAADEVSHIASEEVQSCPS
jgi:DNA-binding response OmpR family regulator